MDLNLLVSVEKVKNTLELQVFSIPNQTVLNFAIPLRVEKSTVTLTESGKVFQQDCIY